MCFSKIRYGMVVAFCAVSTVLCVAQQSLYQREVGYLSIQVPGALGTFPMSVNDSMASTGYYLVSTTVAQGFLQDAEGVITTFRVGGSVWTEPESINAAGEITGFFETIPGVPQGFLRYADGRIVTFNPPGVPTNLPQAMPVVISDFGEIAGNYPYPNVAASGFSRSRGGVFRTIDYATGAAYSTVVTGLNGSGTVVGYSFDGEPYSSFLLHPDGFLTHFDVPVGEPFVCFRETIAESVNAEGAIAGWYVVEPPAPGPSSGCAKALDGGFVRSPQGVFTLFNPPGTIVTSPQPALPANPGSLSAPHRRSLNQEGAVAGSYTDVNLAQHGFVREADGVITSFDPPGAMQTTATSMNDSGVIAGYFYYPWNAQTSVGFLRIP